jgi:hypothetical protein
MKKSTISSEKITLPILSSIRSKFGVMAIMQRKFTKFVLNNPAESERISIGELTVQADIKSDSSMVRSYRMSAIFGYQPYTATPPNEIGDVSFFDAYGGTGSMEDVKRMIYKRAIRAFHANSLILRGKFHFYCQFLAQINPIIKKIKKGGTRIARLSIA